MSSIFGAWQINKKPIAPTSVQQAIEKTAWWNPDQQGHYHEQHIFLAHQLLATSSQQAQELQPYQDALAQLYIVADARLDNRKELQGLLGIKDNQLPDAQLILAAYKRYGKDCVQHLIGAFAFAIWDEKEQQLFCVRDQMGVKPFNYYFQNQLFAFGTQKKSILALADIDKTANWRYIFNHLSSIGVPPNTTEYQHLQKLPPAHYLIVNQAGMQLQQYWELDIQQTTTYQKDEDYIAHFRELFQQAIADRLVGNQAVGAHLSGGLDSSGITSFADAICKKKNQPFHAFAYSVPIDFVTDKPERVEENLLAFDVVDYCRLANFHNVTNPIERTFREVIEQETIACDGYSQSNNVNTEYEIQAAAQAQGVGVLLSGFPGDELVTSFCRPFYLEYLERGQLGAYFFSKDKSRHQYKEKAQALVAAKAVNWFPNLSKQMAQWYVERRAKGRKYVGAYPILNKDYFSEDPGRAMVLKKEIYPMNHAQFPTSLKAYQRNHVCRPHTTRRMESETLGGLRFKVEYRYPMTDIRLLQYVLSVPVEQKISSDMSRRIYRRSMEGYLPDSIRLRDVKNRGSLKPMNMLHPPKAQEDSKVGLWETIKDHQAAPYVNMEFMDKYISSKRSPYGMYNWFLLGQLGVEGKLVF